MYDKYIVLIIVFVFIFAYYLKRSIKKELQEKERTDKEKINENYNNDLKEKITEELYFLEKQEEFKETATKEKVHENKNLVNNEILKKKIVKENNNLMLRNKQHLTQDHKTFSYDFKISNNKTFMQFFEWNLNNDGTLYKKIINEVPGLSQRGISALWLPPAGKGANGINDVGYGAYDLYDLGEFNAKGTIRTKYGTKDEYINAIKTAHENNVEIYADIVFNHKAGADGSEIVKAVEVDRNNRNLIISEAHNIKCHTVFNFETRNNKYSDYKWSAKDFTGVDYDELNKRNGIFKFADKQWSNDVDPENGNYDYLMFSDIDMNSKSVREELVKYGKWLIDETKIDGFRLDAVKHIQFDFFSYWLKEMREYAGKDMFAVGEYWAYDSGRIKYFMDKSSNCMSVFDVPLHFAFHEASKSFGYFDMRNLIKRSMVSQCPEKICTFVDNHDTQIGQSLQSWVEEWFKPLAYTFILTRKEGYPCVFYGDYYGINNSEYNGIREILDIILSVRKKYAYGAQHDYFDHESIVGWTREGDIYHDNSGLAALITDEHGGKKKMFIGTHFAGKKFYDITGNVKESTIIDEDGFGEFLVQDGSYSIYVLKQERT